MRPAVPRGSFSRARHSLVSIFCGSIRSSMWAASVDTEPVLARSGSPPRRTRCGELFINISPPVDLVRRSNGSLLRHLAEGALPVLDMVGPRDLAVLEGVNIEGHEFEGLAVGRRSHEFACRRAGCLAAYDDPIS